MLKLMRENTGSWIIKILLGLIVLVFVFLGMGSMGSKKGDRVASVNGEPITMKEYQRSYQNVLEQMRRRFGDNLNDELIGMLQVKKQALDRLIEDRLVANEAEKMDITVSDKEVRDSLLNIQAFRKNGVFDMETYKRVLARNRMSPESFETMQKASLRNRQVQELVLESVAVSDMEAAEWYRYNNAEISIDYAEFDPASYTEITPGDEKIREFYEKNKENYKSSAMVKVRYLKFSSEGFQKEVNVSLERLKAYYEENLEEFKVPPKVEARHILIKVAENADTENVQAAKKQADQVYEKALAGEDFASLAETFSQGPSKNSGGYLGSFTRDSMVKPFADKAFSMEAGDISEPVRTQFGFHVIKVEAKFDASEKSFEEAKPAITERLEKEEAQNLAYYAAGKAFDAVIDGDDLEQAGLIADEKVVTSDPFTRKGPRDFGPGAAEFAKTAFSLPLMEISDVKEIGNAYYLIKPVTRKEPAVLEFEAAKEQAAADLTEEMQLNAAKEEASAFFASVEKLNDLAAAAQKKGIQVETTGSFTRKEAVPGINNSASLVKAGFELTEKDRICDEVLKSNNRFYVIALNEKTVPGQEAIDNNLAEVKKELKQTKQNRVYDGWISELKKKGTIEIQEGILD
ncbi:MAG: SurA N-terminal domain-containing protein [Desulfobacteraceae bacterium]